MRTLSVATSMFQVDPSVYGAGVPDRCEPWPSRLYTRERTRTGRRFMHQGYCGPILFLLAALPFCGDASQVVRWGNGLGGQYEIPPGLTNAVALSAGFDHVLALRSDGTVICWGFDSHGQTEVPPGLSNVVQVAAGDYHSLALRTDGTVVAWGNRQDDLPADLQDVVAIVAGSYSLALKADGSVVGWGFAMDTMVAQPPPTLPPLRAVAAGGQHALGIQRDRMVVAWGENQYQVTEVPPGLTDAVAVPDFQVKNAHYDPSKVLNR